tara:strand:+ start:3430 stop:5499 length:2070 start_codon:yes stop_codon:yes gene_type:complete
MSNLEPLVQIGDWYYQAAYGQLLPVAPEQTDNVPMVLEPRLHSLLNYFLLHPDQIIDKDTLITDVWPSGEGTDAAVMRAVGALRKKLGDDVKSPVYIVTIAKKGYRWLCHIEPMTTSHQKPFHTDTKVSNKSLPPATLPSVKAVPWRFISAVCSVLLLGGAALAYILASLTVTPLTQLPDTVKPISAITGQEFWPTLAEGQEHVFYIYRKSEADQQQLARQDLLTLKVSYSDEFYRAVSQPLWLTDNQLLFRAVDLQQQCYFYQQQVLPDFQSAQKLMPCQQVLDQGLALLEGRWYWLDYDANAQRYELWQRDSLGKTERLMTMPAQWQKADQLLAIDSALYLVARYDFDRSRLYRVDLQQRQLEPVTRFDNQVLASSVWDQQHMLLTQNNKPLQLLNIESGEQLSLGPMSWLLTQPQRYQQRILTTQFLDYTTDIVQVLVAERELRQQDSWQASNRNERLYAANDRQIAFVSERAGDNQIWLSQSGESRQLTTLNADQYIQQLFWHENKLWTVVNSRLYNVALIDGSLQPMGNEPVSGRYGSCHDELYWTAQNDDGWQLMQLQQQQPVMLLSGVVNFRCAPNGLVLQFYNDSGLALWADGQPLSVLPLSLNWHQVLPEQWSSNSEQLLWIDSSQWQLKTYNWQSGQINSYTWPARALPLQIYSDQAGSIYTVQPRHYDTDIVWLQNRG